MKKIVISCFLVLLAVSVAMATWTTWITDFQNNYDSFGIGKAVTYALEEGATPDVIVENGLQLDDLTRPDLIMALYCAGANGADIRAAAEHWEISKGDVAKGYKKATEVCDNVIADIQAYTEGSSGLGGASLALSSGNTGYATPSTF